MKKIFIIITALSLISCKKTVYTTEEPSFETDTYHAKWSSCPVTRTDLLTEGEELHEVFIIEADTARITDHCDDCKYCRIQNEMNN